jgi:uncharacterized protein
VQTGSGAVNENVFFDALKARNHKSIRFCLEQGADPNSEFCELTPLRFAVSGDDEGLVELLLQYGARPTIEDTCEQVLMEAVHRRLDRAVTLLLKYGADANRPTPEGHTSLGCATYCLPDAHIASILLQHRADPNQFDSARQTFPFISAARYFKKEALEEFLRYGADPLVMDTWGNTALMLAVLRPYQQTAEVVTSLLDLSIPVNHQNLVGNTALHEAARAGNAAAIQFLLSAGADHAIKNKEGDMPLMILLSSEDLEPQVVKECVELLENV